MCRYTCADVHGVTFIVYICGVLLKPLCLLMNIKLLFFDCD